MPSDMLTTLKNLDPALLLDPVRRDQRSQMLEIVDWIVEPIRHEAIVDSTGGLYRFSGHGRDERGVLPWSIVLKILNGTNDPSEDITSVSFWKREALAFESGLFDSIPNAVRPPRYYSGIERENGNWLWMEYLVDQTKGRWSAEHFRRALYQFGRFGGAYLTGTPLPQAPWFSSPSLRSLLIPWQSMMNPHSDTSLRKHPVVQRYFGDLIRAYSLSVLSEMDHFCAALDQLPQVFCHKDLHRRNLMFCATPDGQDELVAIDWAWCGNGAVGIDAGWTFTDALMLMDFDMAQAAELEAVILDGYLNGLRDAGWSGDERLVRLGYLFPLTFWMAVLPGWAALMLGNNLDADTVPMYGHSAPEVLQAWLAMEDFLMPRVEQTRALMRELNL